MTWAMDCAPESLTPTQRHVLLVLADYVNDETLSAYPSIATLSGRTGLSERAIRMALRALETHGIIATHFKGALGSGARNIPADRRPNLYRWIAEDSRGERRSARRAIEGNEIPPRGERDAPREGNDVPPNLHKNPYITPTPSEPSREFEIKAVLEAIRARVPEAASWLGKKALPALDAGWLPYDIALEITREPFTNARSVSAILGHRLDDLATRRPIAPKVKLAWCGECDETTRLREVNDGQAVARCSNCHPSILGVAQ